MNNKEKIYDLIEKNFGIDVSIATEEIDLYLYVHDGLVMNEESVYEVAKSIKDVNREIVICSAVVAEDGSIFRGHRHGDAILAMRNSGRKPASESQSFSQGFITSKNRYVSREEAYELQENAGIPSILQGTDREEDAYRNGKCYSEDLY